MNGSFDLFLINHLREIGIKSDDYVLDFGCGEGNYAIPTAVIVGNQGKIFVVDEEISKLEKLEVNAENKGISENIQIIQTEGNFDFSLENETINITLLYNVTCCILGKDDFPNFQKLIREI